MNDIEKLKQELQSKIEILDAKIAAHDLEISIVHNLITGLEEKRAAKDKKDYTQKIQLEQAKRDFWDSGPHTRKDPMTNWELVMWASYLLSRTDRAEILQSTAEVAKRANRIRLIVDYFKEKEQVKSPEKQDKELDALARILTKNYLEYVLLGVPKFMTKKGEAPMTFWVAVSPWAVNNFSYKVASWMKIKDIPDEKPKDED